MKLMNYDAKYLIEQNLKTNTVEIPQTFTLCQYRILCRLIKRKKVTKQFFRFLLMSLFNTEDWKKLDYLQMYQLIYTLSHWNYEKRGI